jgi:hypothetical protein
MKCEEAQELMLQELGGVLEAARREGFEAHVGACEDCAVAWAAFQRLSKALPELEAEPPPELAVQIKRRVWEECGRRQGRRVMAWAAAVAAAASLLVGLALGEHALAGRRETVRTVTREVRVPVERIVRVEVPVKTVAGAKVTPAADETVRAPVHRSHRTAARPAREPARVAAVATRPEEAREAEGEPSAPDRPRTVAFSAGYSRIATAGLVRPVARSAAPAEAAWKPEDLDQLARELAGALESFEGHAVALRRAPTDAAGPPAAAEPAGRTQP